MSVVGALVHQRIINGNSKSSHIDTSCKMSQIEFEAAFETVDTISFPPDFDMTSYTSIRGRHRHDDEEEEEYASKRELDAGLESVLLKREKEDGEESVLDVVDDVDGKGTLEMEMGCLQTEPKKKGEKGPEVDGGTTSPRRKSKRKSRRKRGESLERQIRKLILENVSNDEGSNDSDQSTTYESIDKVPSPNDILSDLGKTTEAEIASVYNQGLEKELIVDCISHQESLSAATSTPAVESPSPSPPYQNRDGFSAPLPPNQNGDTFASPSPPTNQNDDAFNWDEEWTAFGAFPVLNGGSITPDKLDENGFPYIVDEVQAVQARETTPKQVDLAGESSDPETDDEEEEMALELAKEMEEEMIRDRILEMAHRQARKQEGKREPKQGASEYYNVDADIQFDESSEVFDDLEVAEDDKKYPQELDRYGHSSRHGEPWDVASEESDVQSSTFFNDHETKKTPTSTETTPLASSTDLSTRKEVESQGSSHDGSRADDDVEGQDPFRVGSGRDFSCDGAFSGASDSSVAKRRTNAISRSHSPSSFSREEATSLAASSVFMDVASDPADSVSEFSASVAPKTTDEPSSPSSVTQFSESRSRSSHQRYLQARAFVKKRRSRSNHSRRSNSAEPSAEMKGNGHTSSAPVQLKWKPTPPKHYHRTDWL